MKTRILSFIVLSFTMMLQVAAQQLKQQCHVVSALMNEPLPYVSVFVSPDNATITNSEGDFTITAKVNEMVKISHTGYKALTFKASELPKEVKMETVERTPHQLTAIPTEDILMKVVKQLKKEYNKKGVKRSQYFCRMTSNVNMKEELTEAFLEAASAINLRDLKVLDGRRGQITRWGLISPSLSDINLQHALELGPMTLDVPFWNGQRMPLPANANKGYYGNYFVTQCEVLQDPEHGKVYCLDMQKRDAKKKNFLVGKIYVKAGTYQLLRFEGELTDMVLEMTKHKNRVEQPATVKININYRLKNGFTEVDDIACEIDGGEHMHTLTVLHNISDLDINFKKFKKKAAQENMLTQVAESGYDEGVWAYTSVIQRTKMEKALAQQQSIIDQAALTQDTGNDKIDQLIDRARLFGQRIPQEKVFLHLDNTCYFLGDTIWYAAYTRQTSDDRPSTISNVLYVELLNHDGYTIERQVVKMRNGRGHGNIYLDPEYYSGFYEIRAYTRWQLNWGVNEREHGYAASHDWFISEQKEQEFFRDYDKLYSRVVPVYDNPKEDEEFVHDMTLRPLRRQFRNDPDKRELQLTLFPEGGNLVAGVPCRVAFEAAWEDGEWEEGTLQFDSIEAVTVHRGRGVFTFTPSASRQHKAVFTTTKGEKVTAKWPKVEKSGVALKVDYADPKWKIELQMTDDLQPDSLALTVMHEGVLTHVQSLKERHKVIELTNGQLAPGVHQVTVFGQSGRVYADRLFFVTSPELCEPTLRINGLKDEYDPYEKISLDIRATKADQAATRPISLAVRDVWTQDNLYDSGNMMTEMLLGSEIKGFIPHPEWYFESQDDEHRTGLDLLMMTQGWRRFSWREMAVPGEFELTQPDEKNMVIDGAVEGYMSPEYIAIEKKNSEHVNGTGNNTQVVSMSYKDMLDAFSKHPKKELTVHAELVEGQTLQAIQTEMKTQDYRFRFRLPDFYDKSVLFISTADLNKVKLGKNYNWIQSAYNPENEPTKHRFKYRMMAEEPDFMAYIIQPWPRYAQPFSWYQNHLAPIEDSEKGEKGRRRFSDGTIQLEEISIKAKHNGLRNFSDAEPALFVDAYDAYNNNLDAGFLYVDPEFLVRGYIGDMGLEDPYAQDLDAIDEDGVMQTKRSARIYLRFGMNQTRRALNHWIDTDSVKALETMGGQEIDTLFHRQHLWSMDRELTNGELLCYFKPDREMLPTSILDISKLDKFVMYTDYAPRQAGSKRFLGTDLPETSLAVYPYADGGRRMFYRDRRMIIQGFNIADDFYHPDYSKRPLPEQGKKDRRRTLYWNPDLQLDAEGHATVDLYNCSRNTHLSVTAEGMTQDGSILTGNQK